MMRCNAMRDWNMNEKEKGGEETMRKQSMCRHERMHAMLHASLCAEDTQVESET